MSKSEKINAPKINRTAVCIANSLPMAAVVSSYFQKADEYFCVFWFPDVTVQPQNVLQEFVLNYAEVSISNRIRSIKPDFIVCAGLNDFQQRFVEKLGSKVISINSYEEMDEKLPVDTAIFNGTVHANEHNILAGLYLASIENKKLVYDPNAKKLPRRFIKNKQNVLILDKSTDVGAVCSVNYALASDSDLVILKQATKEFVKTVERQQADKDPMKRQSTKQRLRKRLRNIPFDQYNYAVFATDGLPYGSAMDNVIPNCHVPIRYSPYFIFDNVYCHASDSFFSATLFSPESFDFEEMDELDKLLTKHDYNVKSLRGDGATSTNFGNYAQYYPYDLLHICSHGGETDGYFVVEKIRDRHGEEHTVEYYEIVNFHATDKIGDDGQPMIAVMRKMLWHKLDGLEWGSKRLSQAVPQYVFEDLIRHLETHNSEDDDLVRTPVNYSIAGACFIECTDGFHQGMFHCLASTSSPIIFNNSCSSWSEIAKHALAMGCRGYLGTLRAIGSPTAKASAEYIYDACLNQDKTFMQAVFEANHKISNEQYAHIYHYWGMPFTNLKSSPDADISRSRVFDRLNQSLYLYLRMAEDPAKRDSVMENCAEAARFIFGVVFDDYETEVKTEIARMEKEMAKLPPVKNDDITRGVIRPITTEQNQNRY